MTTKLPDTDSMMAGLTVVWQTVGADAVGYSATEKAELVLDRARGLTGYEVDMMINEYGYEAVLELVTNILFGGR